MIERGGRLRLLYEPLLAPFVRHALGRKDFDGHESIQARIAGFIDFAHGAGAQRREDHVRAETSSLGDGYELWILRCCQVVRAIRRQGVEQARDQNRPCGRDVTLRQRTPSSPTRRPIPASAGASPSDSWVLTAHGVRAETGCRPY